MSEKHSELVFVEQVALLYKLMPVGFIATIINSIVIAILLLDYVPSILLLLWVVLLLIVTILRILSRRFAVKQVSQKKNLDFWANIFIAGIFVSGMLWGSAAFFSLFHTSGAHRMVVAYVLGGMASGASATYAAVRRAYFAFSVPALLPQIIIFFIFGDMLYIAMGGMLLLFSILITASALTNHKTTLTSFHLRFERNDLIDSLTVARDQTERKNEALRKEVQQREYAEAALREAQMLLEEKVNIRTAELQTANNRLEDANRELSDFTHSVSHDLRSPLFSIDNFGTILEEESGDTLNESAKEALFFMRKATHRMQELIKDLLVLAKASRMELSMEPVDMSAIVLEIISTLRADQTGRNVELVVQPGIEEMCDKRLIRIALENLIGNAWKYTGKTENARIEFGLIRKGNEKIFFIADNGAGFDMSQAYKLFAPFKRLHSDSTYPGTGVGLTTVQKIIYRHSGKIWAESSPGKGATFYFTLNA